MNVFVLTPGRSGSATFSRACSHITNYTSAHESRISVIGPDRLAYPDDHIEVDNRLSWLLGRLDQMYGDRATYVHLRRDATATARSFEARSAWGIMQAYASAIHWKAERTVPPIEIARDYLQTVEADIGLFLRDKSRQLDFQLENAHTDLPRFWEAIGAVGDYTAALSEFDVRHNAR